MPETPTPVETTEATPNNNIHRVATRDRISVRLTTEEIRDRAMLLPGLISDLDAVESEAKSVAKEYKKKIDKCDAAMRDMKRVVDSGEEWREVECHKVFDVSKGIVWIEYEGQKYGQRSATEKELEMLRTKTLFEPVDGTDEDTTDDTEDDTDEDETEESPDEAVADAF